MDIISAIKKATGNDREFKSYMDDLSKSMSSFNSNIMSMFEEDKSKKSIENRIMDESKIVYANEESYDNPVYLMEVINYMERCRIYDRRKIAYINEKIIVHFKVISTIISKNCDWKFLNERFIKKSKIFNDSVPYQFCEMRKRCKEYLRKNLREKLIELSAIEFYETGTILHKSITFYKDKYSYNGDEYIFLNDKKYMSYVDRWIDNKELCNNIMKEFIIDRKCKCKHDSDKEYFCNFICRQNNCAGRCSNICKSCHNKLNKKINYKCHSYFYDKIIPVLTINNLKNLMFQSLVSKDRRLTRKLLDFGVDIMSVIPEHRPCMPLPLRYMTPEKINGVVHEDIIYFSNMDDIYYFFETNDFNLLNNKKTFMDLCIAKIINDDGDFDRIKNLLIKYDIRFHKTEYYCYRKHEGFLNYFCKLFQRRDYETITDLGNLLDDLLKLNEFRKYITDSILYSGMEMVNKFESVVIENIEQIFDIDSPIFEKRFYEDDVIYYLVDKYFENRSKSEYLLKYLAKKSYDIVLNYQIMKSYGVVFEEDLQKYLKEDHISKLVRHKANAIIIDIMKIIN